MRRLPAIIVAMTYPAMFALGAWAQAHRIGASPVTSCEMREQGEGK
ncbi:MAG: hypothetical protein GY844_26370 [Bradyrhizobium sp.]|jgi:hypothetical protein|nr:hypothetical protein [Bradyrhizobium sp.]